MHRSRGSFKFACCVAVGSVSEDSEDARRGMSLQAIAHIPMNWLCPMKLWLNTVSSKTVPSASTSYCLAGLECKTLCINR